MLVASLPCVGCSHEATIEECEEVPKDITEAGCGEAREIHGRAVRDTQGMETQIEKENFRIANCKKTTSCNIGGWNKHLACKDPHINDAMMKKVVVWCVCEPNLETTRHLRVDQKQNQNVGIYSFKQCFETWYV